MVMKKILVLTGMVFIVLTLTINEGYTFSPADLQTLKNTNACVDCDLTGADLTGADLQIANLSGANLSGANLSGANLSNAWLVDSNLSKAKITKTIFDGATLDGAVWTDGKLCADGSMGMCNK
jgi:uncharacterized protein YjbI with pentapeptide repeats